MAKTIQEINEKIKRGRAVVVTAEEILEVVREIGPKQAAAGRGRITVNWENCIKCESCWRAEPTGVLWGRFTDHRLIYRPVSGALPVLLASLKDHAATLLLKTAAANTDTLPEAPELVHVRNAATAFREAIAQLPAAADAGRLSWPAALGTRLTEKLAALEGLLRSGGHAGPAAELKFDRDALGLRIREGQLYHALYAISRIEQRLRPAGADAPTPNAAAVQPAAVTAEEFSRLFPDRVVKQWEETPMPEEWAVKLRDLIGKHRSNDSGLPRPREDAALPQCRERRGDRVRSEHDLADLPPVTHAGAALACR